MLQTSDCKLFLGNGCGYAGRVSLSSGVTRAPVDHHPVAYESVAVVPKKPWNSLENSQLESLLTEDDTCDLRDNLAIVKLDENSIALAEKIKIREATSFGCIEKIIRSDIYCYNDFLKSMLDFYASYELSGARRHKIGFDIGLANQETTTINRDVNKKTGMHIDIWDNYTLHEAREATNRICINLGQEDRYFLYVNMTLGEIYQHVSHHPEFNSTIYKQSKLASTFFKLYPDYPVIRVRVSPFEAYIAPTENIIHDGSTQGINSPDVTYTVRGDFRLL